LLEDPTADFSALRDHLSQCPRCQELADRIVDTQFELRQHVEDFVSTTTLDSSWQRALEQVDAPSRPSRFGLHAVGVFALTAAVLVFAYGGLGPEGGKPTEPGDPKALSAGVIPIALQEAEEKLEAFRDIDNTTLELDGLSRADEDAVQRDALAAKTEAMEEALAALQVLVDGEDADLRAAGLEGTARTYDEMADSLANMPLPTYLDEAQGKVYRRALLAKAGVQWEKAIEAYRLAAKAQGDRERASALRERAKELEGRLRRGESPSKPSAAEDLNRERIPDDPDGADGRHE